jgi:DNA-binding NarL/FixJ family response regulator
MMNTAKCERDVVLIVDDTPANLAYLSEALDEAGYMVLVAIDGITAMDQLRLVTPDIILLDAVMPGMDGFDTCRQIKGSADTRGIPVIFMTALVDTADVVRGFHAGAVDYVTKPVKQEEVLARIATHILCARDLARAQCTLEASGKAGLTLDGQGRITWETPRAARWREDYGRCPAASTAPLASRLQSWLGQADQQGLSEPSLSIQAADNRLTFHYAGRVAGGECLLLVEEQSVMLSAQRLSGSFGLTHREAEVLSWVAAGKTNRDIGDILGMSPRTVNKHLEHVYVKLGVETRAAAAALSVQKVAAPVAAGKNN